MDESALSLMPIHGFWYISLKNKILMVALQEMSESPKLGYILSSPCMSVQYVVSSRIHQIAISDYSRPKD